MIPASATSGVQSDAGGERAVTRLADPVGAGRLVIRIHGLSVGVVGAPELLRDTIWPLLACWHPAPWLEDEGVDVRVCMSRRGESAAACDYTLTCAEGPPMAAPDVASLLCLFQAWFDLEVVRRVEGLVPVHAGVVGYRDKAVLLPARSGAGKTTLVASLLERGARYLSDEIALLDDQGRVHPYPRPLMMRDRTQQQSPVPPSALGGCIGTTPLPVGVILFLEYRAHARLELEQRDASHSFLLLLRHTWARLSEPVAPIQPLLRACDTALTYQGVRGEAAAAADEILRLVAAL